MSDLGTPTTARARVALARRSALRLHAVEAPVEAAGSIPLTAPAGDDRLRRRELLLHHLEMERSRRRRRTA